MVVHLGVVLATVAIVSSVSFSTHTTVDIAPGASASVGGHSVAYEALQVVRSPVRSAIEVVVRVDGGGLFYPAVSKFAGGTVATPAIDSSLLGDDVYLTFNAIGQRGTVSSPVGTKRLRPNWVELSVTVEPYVSWLWVGGLLAGFGGVLALAPAPRRRRLPDTQVAEPVRELEVV